MRITSIILLVLLKTINTFGQQTEFGISLNSGLFSFRGPSAEKETFILVNEASEDNLTCTNNPYGSKNGLLYGFSINLQLLTKRKFILGIDLGYENLRSLILIKHILIRQDFGSFPPYNASGKSILNHHFINVNPYFGYSVKLKKYSMDFLAGTDLAYCLFAKERGSWVQEFDNEKQTITKNQSTIRFDFRPRIQSTIQYKKYGLYAAYSIGLVNYQSGYVGGINECYSRMFRFGLTYKL